MDVTCSDCERSRADLIRMGRRRSWTVCCIGPNEFEHLRVPCMFYPMLTEEAGIDAACAMVRDGAGISALQRRLGIGAATAMRWRERALEALKGEAV